jgi:hypothetical protein
MHAGKFVFAQLTEHLPLTTFRRCVARYDGEHKIKRFTCLEQFLCLAFAQLTYRESLRDIEACLRAHREKLYHMGIRSRISRSTLADANEVRDWRIYADFAQRLIVTARTLYAGDSFGVDLAETINVLDTTTIDLCLSALPWEPFRRAKTAAKLHTPLELRGEIPVFVHIGDGNTHEVNILDQLAPDPGAFYIVDQGFLDFEQLLRFHESGSFFVTGETPDLKAQRRHRHTMTGFQEPLRRIRLKDSKTDQRLVLLTNNFVLPASTVTDLYRCRRQIALFFKWVKEHLRIKQFYGTSENAVKTQIWIAVSVYMLVAIVKKRLNISASLYEMLQMLSLTMFEKTPINSLLSTVGTESSDADLSNQINLFN